MIEELIDDNWLSNQLKQLPVGSLKRNIESVTLPPFRVPIPVGLQIGEKAEKMVQQLRLFPKAFQERLLYSLYQYLELASVSVPVTSYVTFSCFYFEWLMYTDALRKRYRDHVTHAIRVAYLGNWMLNQEWGGRGSPLINRVTTRIKKSPYVDNLKQEYGKRRAGDIVNDSVVRTAWWLAGLFHDIGCPFGFFVQTESIIAESYGFYNADACEGIKRLIKRQERSLLFRHLRAQMGGSDKKVMDFLSEKAVYEGKRHGIAAALCLLLWLEELELHSSVDLKRRMAFELAALAVARHDLLYMFQKDDDTTGLEEYRDYFANYKVGFEEDPLSFLLVLADKIQEWGRPMPVPENLRQWEIKFHYHIECIAVHLKQANRRLKIKYILDRNATDATDWDDRLFLEEKKMELGKDSVDPRPLFDEIVPSVSP